MKEIIKYFLDNNINNILLKSSEEAKEYFQALSEKELYKYLMNKEFINFLENNTDIITKLNKILNKILNINNISKFLIDFYEYKYDEEKTIKR
jgi:hypothetical protein